MVFFFLAENQYEAFPCFSNICSCDEFDHAESFLFCNA